MPVRGVFISGAAGRIFVVSHEPSAPVARAVLVVPAFAEEMNKSRRLVHETAEALERAGVWTIAPDLFGTGDSEGEFEEARWNVWIDDLRRTLDWARALGAERFGVLMVRLGTALYRDAEAQLATTFERAVAWQPLLSGAEALRLLLRTKIMAIRMAGGTAPSLEALLQSLLTGAEPMELGGYLVSPQLAAAIQRAAGAIMESRAVREGMSVEIEPAASAARSAATEETAAGGSVWTRVRIPGERFWLAVEPRPIPALVEATARFLAS
jgi:exosortase A-associated hydrolase 2